MFEWPKVKILGASKPGTIIIGGMGTDVSNPLVEPGTNRGLVVAMSTVGLRTIYSKLYGRPVSDFEAAKLEAEFISSRLSKSQKLLFGANAMAMMECFEDSVRGAEAGGAKYIFTGAGFSWSLPTLVDSSTAIIPIVSSARALEAICRRWERHGRMPDGVVLEGPLAGGHLGFKAEDIDNPAFQLEELFGPVLAVSQKYGGFPIFVAGGIYSIEDIIRWLNAGASGVQMGTRFLATDKSGAADEAKAAVVAATAEDIIVIIEPGSPSGFAFRIYAKSSGYLKIKGKCPDYCAHGYMARKGERCLAMTNPKKALCLCRLILGAAKRNPFPDIEGGFTMGARAWEIDRIMPFDEVVDEITGYDIAGNPILR